MSMETRGGVPKTTIVGDFSGWDGDIPVVDERSLMKEGTPGSRVTGSPGDIIESDAPLPSDDSARDSAKEY